MIPPLVSIVIPSFNRAYCIAKTIDSALAQTHRELEVIVVDDGSTDDTAEVVERTYRDEPRVRYLRQQNQGVAGARNYGLRVARGDYIALLDSDDVWHRWKIEAQLRCLDALPQVGMIWTDMDAIDPAGQVVARRYLRTMYSAYSWFTNDELFERSMPFRDVDPVLAGSLGDPVVYSGDIFSQMVLGNLVHTSTVLLRRERLERVKTFDVALRHSGEDYDFHLRTCRAGPVAYLDAASILYQRGRGDQLTVVPAFKLDMATNFLATIEPVIDRDRERIRLPRVMIDEVLAEAHAWVGERQLDRGNNHAAVVSLVASLRRKPRQARVLSLLALGLLPASVAGTVRQAFRSAKARLKQPASVTKAKAPEVPAVPRLLRAASTGGAGRWTGVVALRYPHIGVSWTCEAFERQLRWLEANFDIISPRDLGYVVRVKRGRHVLLSFDEGYVDAFTHAFPILSSRRVPATFFVTPRHIDRPVEGEPSAWMTWGMLRELQRAGMTVGGQAAKRASLRRIAPEARSKEILECAQRLREELDTPMRTFAHPVGPRDAVDDDARACLRQAGVHAAFSVCAGFRDLGAWDAFDIPRIALAPETSLDQLRSLVMRPRTN